MNHRLFAAILILATASLACGGTIDLPKVPTAGATVVEQVSIPAPAADVARLTISFGAGELKLAPGASELVEGTAKYNVEDLKPEIHVDGSSIEIKQRDLLTLIEPRDVISTWDFKLGDHPTDLTINAGAYTGDLELGGVPLTSLTVKDGAATVHLSFKKRNPSSMAIFRYETGASTVTMTGLANANFATMTMGSGAGSYILDFSGGLQRDATITISTGLSDLTLVIPKGVPATVTAETGLSSTNAGPTWIQDDNRYTQSGSGPALTFIIKGGAGNLTLSN